MNVSPSTMSNSSIARSGQGAHAGFSIGTGALLGGFLLGAVYIFPAGSTMMNIATVAAFTAVFIALAAVYRTLRPTVSKAWTSRFAAGLGITMAFYGAALAFGLAVASELTSPLLWVPIAIVVALPVAVLGSVGIKR